MSNVTLNVMAPLVIGNPADMDSEASRKEWTAFEQELTEIARLGAAGVSIDIWWGLVEPQPGRFSWDYYDRAFEYISKAGLKVIPILSTHKCGGNVNDGGASVPLPAWLFPHAQAQTNSADVKDVQFVSEQGNASDEFVSVWATSSILPEYVRLMRAFRDHFATSAGNISEVNISLGPTGELRYPSYNAHDKGTGWPKRGALQCYSRLAKESFRAFVLKKHGTLEAAGNAWGRDLNSDGINPPNDVQAFFDKGEHKSAYGKDFFDWYSDSLISHGRQLMEAALDVFNEQGSAFAGIDLGAKIPGIHWRMGEWKDGKVVLADRLAELPTGLIRTSTAESQWNSDDDGRGYRQVISLFSDLQKFRANARVVLHFTCLEMPDGGDGKTPEEKSLAKTLVRWVGAEARRQGVPIKGENALDFKLQDAKSWENMRSALAFPGQDAAYEGLTVLRMSDVLSSDLSKSEFKKTAEQAAPGSTQCEPCDPVAAA